MPKNANHYQSFLLRIWRVKDGRRLQWRITLEDTLIGKVWSFPNLETLMAHLQCLDDLGLDRNEDPNNSIEK